MKIDLKKVLAVSEYSGLFLSISESKNGVIVESMVDKKRTCMGLRAKVTSLADIAIFTETGELRLKEVFERIKNLPPEQEVPEPKSDVALLRSFFQEVIPDYDRDRFYTSHMKKVVEWFRLLRSNDALEFEEENEEEGKEEEKESKEENPMERSNRAGLRQGKGGKLPRANQSGMSMMRKGGRGE